MQALPTQNTPITDANTKAMRALNWQWITWLYTLREDSDTKALQVSSSDLGKAVNYFSAFRRADGFMNLADSYLMPSDARVDFIYIPTLVACGILHLYRTACGSTIHDQLIADSLIAAAGRQLKGHGYEGNRYLAYSVHLLAIAKLIPVCANTELPSGFQILLFSIEKKLQAPEEEHSWGAMPDGWPKSLVNLLNSYNNKQAIDATPIAAEFNTEFGYPLSSFDYLNEVPA